MGNALASEPRRRLFALGAAQPTFQAVTTRKRSDVDVKMRRDVCTPGSQLRPPASVFQKAASTREASATTTMAACVAATLPSTNRAKVREGVPAATTDGDVCLW